MQEPETWRTLLGTLISEPLDKQHIAAKLEVSPSTLTRWVESKATPRQEGFHHLLRLFPAQQRRLLALFLQEFPTFSAPSEEESGPEEIPLAFYRRILSMLASLPSPQVMWSCSQLILQQALEHLDPQQQSVALLMTQCVPPSSGKHVRSLRSVMGIGIAPWGGKVEEQSLFLGADTVPGQVVSSGLPLTVQNYQNPQYSGPESRVGAMSSCTYPLMHATQLAGTFGAVSSLPEFFVPWRQALLADYAKLASTALPSHLFYSLQDIELRVMPPPTVQLPIVTTLQPRIRKVMKESLKRKDSITYPQAELLVWQQLEEELLSMV